MTARAWSRAETLEPTGGPLPQALDVLLERPPGGLPAVLLLAGERTHRSGWSVRAAVRIAESLAESGRDVVLLDGAVTDPRLHRELSQPNTEGLCDVMLYGASPDTVIRNVAAAGYRFMPAGPRVADPAPILAHELWGPLLSRSADARRTLVVYCRAGASGLGALAQRISTAVVLAERGEVEAVMTGLPTELMVAAVLAPSHDSGPAEEVEEQEGGEPAGAVAGSEEGPETAEGPEAGELPAAIGAEWPGEEGAEPAPPAFDEEPVPAGAPAGPEVVADESAESAEAPASAAHRSGRDVTRAVERRREAAQEPTRGMRMLRIVLIVLLCLAAGWWAWGRYAASAQGSGGDAPASADTTKAGPAPAEAGPDAGGAAGGVAAAATAAARPSGHPSGIALAYSVAIESQPSVDIALRRAAALEKADSTIQFFVSPVTLDSVAHYRVMAGPVADSAAAAALMARLVHLGAKSHADAWSIRPTPFSFLVGEFPTESMAQARRSALLKERVPSYVVAEPYSSGVVAYRLYGGAFEGPALSTTMANMLRKAGVTPNLVRRTGRPPA